jgi:hypothetical protein
MARIMRTIGIGLGALLVVVQFVPARRSNPLETSLIDAPPPVHAVLERACFDCHSNRTTWPWYSYVAPASWLVTHDVEEARAEMNFSAWAEIPERRRGKLQGEIWEEVEKGNMPPQKYLLLHPGAKLTEGDRATLRAWAEGAPKTNGEDPGDHPEEEGEP